SFSFDVGRSMFGVRCSVFDVSFFLLPSPSTFYFLISLALNSQHSTNASPARTNSVKERGSHGALGSQLSCPPWLAVALAKAAPPQQSVNASPARTLSTFPAFW